MEILWLNNRKGKQCNLHKSNRKKKILWNFLVLPSRTAIYATGDFSKTIRLRSSLSSTRDLTIYRTATRRHRLKGAVSYFTHIFFSFFLAFLQTSYGFSPIKTYKLHYSYFILYSETTDRGEITVTTTFTSGLDLCIFPCFKYIVYQINSFALIAK